MTILAGLCSISFRDLAVDEVVALASDAGLAGIEWGADRHVPPGSDAASVADRCADAGLACPSYGTYLFAGRTSHDEVAAACSTAVELGAGNLRIWAPDEAEAADVADIADRAAERGLTVSLEFHPGTRTGTAASTLELLAGADRENLFTYWQPDPALTPVDAIEEHAAVAGHLSHLHVFSWGPGGFADRLPLADGADLWRSVLAADATGRWNHDRWAFLEYVPDDEPACLGREAATLRTWIGEADHA
jgi:sugar phosphate isomerase/epimerase